MAMKGIYVERELLDKIASGDQYAFTMLFEDHHQPLFTFALKLTRSKLLAEEVIQDVFLNIWIHRSKLYGIDNFGAYVNRVTRNLSFNALRTIAKDSVLLGEFKDDLNYPDHSTEELLDYNASAALVRKAIDTLSPQQQQVYRLCQQEGLSYENAAERLGIASSTVHSHMKEALKNIRIFLKKMEIPMVLIALLVK